MGCIRIFRGDKKGNTNGRIIKFVLIYTGKKSGTNRIKVMIKKNNINVVNFLAMTSETL